MHKRYWFEGSCGFSCNQEIEEQTIVKSGEAPITTVNTAMWEKVLELFEKCCSGKGTMDSQEAISKALCDLSSIEKPRNVETEKI